jgi:hypothetical protein
MFPAFKQLAQRYAPLGVSILAYSLDDDPELVDYYLGPGFLPFGTAPTSIPVRPARSGGRSRPRGSMCRGRAYTPSIAVFDDGGRMVGQHTGTRGARMAEGWLRQIGYSPD